VSYPLISGGAVFVTVADSGSNRGTRLYALDQSTGATLWSKPTADTYWWSTAAFDAGQVFVVNSAGLLDAFAASTGQLDWSVQLPPNEILNASTGKLLGTFQAGPPPAFDGQVGLFLNQGTLTAVTDGTTLWSFAGDGGLDTAPIAVGSTVYIGSSTGKLYGLALSTGKQVWSANAGSGIPGPEEQSAAQPLTGLGAGQRLVVVPAGDRLVAYSG